jgi:hypothetical protein
MGLRGYVNAKEIIWKILPFLHHTFDEGFEGLRMDCLFLLVID